LLRSGLGLGRPTRTVTGAGPWQRSLLALAVVLTTNGAAAPAKPVKHSTPVIESITWRDVGLVIQASGPLEPQIFTLTAPYRFVVDLPDADLADANLAHTLAIHNGALEQVRLARKPNGAVRLVVDCSVPTKLQIMQLAGRSTLVIARADEANAALASLITGGGSKAYTGSGQDIQRLFAHETNGGLELSLEAAKPLTYALFQDNPTHLQVKVPAGHFTGILPLPGKALGDLKVSTTPDGTWNLETNMNAGTYQLEQHQSADKTKLTLLWKRLDPHHFPGRPLVVIDPGHGGADPGALGPAGGREKSDCLDLALALQHALYAHKINAVMTRSTDAEMLLEPRLHMIDQVHADLFISLHANSHTTAESTGTEAFWREPASRAFATAVQQSVATLLRRPDRGVKQERLYVLRHTSVPSVLLETGFISNPNEERMLASRAFQMKAAEAIVAGVEHFMASAKSSTLGAASGASGPP
jgi:N-acetylmuramoyl-L-alanine amidase